jgi:hypothetical protein
LTYFGLSQEVVCSMGKMKGLFLDADRSVAIGICH